MGEHRLTAAQESIALGEASPAPPAACTPCREQETLPPSCRGSPGARQAAENRTGAVNRSFAARARSSISSATVLPSCSALAWVLRATAGVGQAPS